MTRDEILYIFPYLISLLITTGVFLYAWKHYYVRGAATYTWFAGGQAFTIFGFILELISPNLQIKLQWDFFQWITDTLVIALFMVFATEFTETKFHHPRLTWFLLLLAPIAFFLVLFTDSVHHLIYPNPHLVAGYPFTQLKYNFTFVIYLYALIYLYGYTLFGLGILFKRAFQPHNLLRQQFFIVAIGFLIPVLFSILSLFDISIGGQRDISPLTLAAGNIIIAWGLFRYGLFDIVPIARERVLENMADQVIVLDARDRVIDINPPALRILGKTSSEIIGKPISVVFSQWTNLVERYKGINDIAAEVEAMVEDQLVYYDLKISPIYDQRKQLVGRVFVAHDITRQKTLEDGYRRLSEKLEQRVQERTKELHESAERFRALFEDSPIPLLEEDFSVVKVYIDQLRESGIRDIESYFKDHAEEARKCMEMIRIVNVNTATLKWYQAPNKEAIRVNVSQLIDPNEYKSFIEELLALIDGGNYYQLTVSRRSRDGSPIHLIITGTVAPAYADSWSRVLVSIQDITESKRAEENLAEAYDTTLEGWAKALELRDKETEGHSRRVTETTLKVARAMGLDEEQLVHLRRGSLLHDIGKMGIPDEILRKQGPLTQDEREIVNHHPQVAYNLLSKIPYLKKALEIPYCHHEKWDGTGYPRGLKGDEIPLTARIFGVVDVWDALSSDRPYRDAWDKERIIQYMRDESGKYFDPKIVETFIELLDQGAI